MPCRAHLCNAMQPQLFDCPLRWGYGHLTPNPLHLQCNLPVLHRARTPCTEVKGFEVFILARAHRVHKAVQIGAYDVVVVAVHDLLVVLRVGARHKADRLAAAAIDGHRRYLVLLAGLLRARGKTGSGLGFVSRVFMYGK